MSVQSSTWFTTEEAAQYLRMQPGSLRTLRCRGGGPRYAKVGGGRPVRYELAALEEFIRGRSKQSA